MASVDTSLHAKTTGAAAAFAADHASEHPLKLYGGWFCPFVQRAWIVMHEKNISHQYIEINPYKKAPEFLALNPRGLVPTLAVPVAENGRVQKPLYESLVICEFLDEAFRDDVAAVDGVQGENHGKSLLPEGPYERARCRLWIDHISNKIIPAFYKFIQHTPDKDYSIEDVRSSFHAQIRPFVKEMGPANEGPWFLGQRFSLVDVMLAPWAKRLFLIDYYKPGGVGIPSSGQGGEDEEIWKRWRVWFKAITDRQSVKDTWSDDDMYIAAYKRYAEDTTQSEVGQATRRGEKLP
ncbi:hypothetical protein DL764_005873 [Monosporascus ibericus]|uniref:GST N-terminal domain-containing protein n=1 Tax=Monosporascus ibericus TaxID=155417 RepID=A0A4Q4T715_9PEZI|nr:hypothetical protein DL764_005873 [Monosporascus ibericus]